MLVLSRKQGQSVLIGDNIIVTVLSRHGDVIKLGFQAPPEVTVHREEIHRRIADERVSMKSANPVATPMTVVSLPISHAGLFGAT